MSNSKVIIYPDELKNASNLAKERYVEWVQISDVIEKHELRYYTVIDKLGDSHTIDCIGVYTMLWKKLDNLRGIPKSDYDEVKRRCLLLHKIKLKKSALNRQWNADVDKKQGKGSVVEFRKADILDAFGQYKNIEQVMELIKSWGLSTSKTKLTEFYYNNKAEIDDRRMRFVASEKDYYLATGTGRIESLSYLYSQLLEKFEETKGVKYASEIRSIIEQVRKEVKGDEIRLTVDGKIDITATMNANLTIQELNRKIPINMFIVGLVAAKKGINPQSIMAQLGNSFYADYNGFREIKGKEEMELPSHFINSYDWNSIEAMHAEKQKKATSKLMDDKLSKFFADNNIRYDGNLHSSMKKLEAVIEGKATPEIVDIEPLEVDVEEKQKPVVQDRRELLRKILEEKREKSKG